jgi:integrase/recombinase XerD
MITITLDLLKHKGKQIVLLKFPYNNQLIAIAKQLPNAAWSNTYKAWYTTSYSIETLNQIKQLFTDIAIIDAQPLKEKLAKQKNSSTAILEIVLIEEALNKIEKFKSWMRSKRYSASTVKTYSEALKSFLKYYNHKPINEITNDDVILFNNDFILKYKLSASYQSQIVNAIKLFFNKIQNASLNIDLVHRPKKYNPLPKVLAEEEVASIINALDNIKHKCMLSLIYSAGLRRSELLKMQIQDIDSKRMQLRIQQSKGGKDRITPLSETVLQLLRQYYITYLLAVLVKFLKQLIFNL